MKKIIATVGLLVATTTHAESIDQLLTDGYEIKSVITPRHELCDDVRPAIDNQFRD